MNWSYVYALDCPVTGATRYVGKADRLRDRFREHLRCYGRTRKSLWIKGLLAAGLRPVFRVLAKVPAAQAAFWEREFIWLFQELNAPMLNLTAGGEGCHVKQAPEAPRETWERLQRAKASCERLGMRMPRGFLGPPDYEI